MTPRRRAAESRLARTLRSAQTPASGHHGTKIATAASAGGSAPVRAAERRSFAWEVAATRAYREGRREQRCPVCGREEAGGSYCTGCDTPVHPDAWTNDTAASRAGRANRAARTS